MIEGRKREEKAKRYGKREAKGACRREGRERGVEDEADEVTG